MGFFSTAISTICFPLSQSHHLHHHHHPLPSVQSLFPLCWLFCISEADPQVLFIVVKHGFNGGDPTNWPLFLFRISNMGSMVETPPGVMRRDSIYEGARPVFAAAIYDEWSRFTLHMSRLSFEPTTWCYKYHSTTHVPVKPSQATINSDRGFTANR